ncbi:primosomal protein N' [Prevotella sp. P2-180]|uniref:replication restart helicase PriA n=1 Tax=Prevotella sp. P2-180 TaxID=2024224 RepID=UPI000B96F12E|nr:primosomal protein N' [Prevotella sp. P2-180]OYP61084.1 primosomal protein N' [Prevotella sp. P2-180]
MRYADVVLPLPLEGFFTYSIPESFLQEGLVGCRVVVPFGKTKTYVALVVRIHDITPKGYKVKPLKQRIDQSPIVNALQLNLWTWISSYYLSAMGDIYKAALPSGLKAEDGYKPSTELYVALAPAFQSEPSLHIALNMLKRATKQLDAFTCFLHLSHWDEIGVDVQTEKIVEITRDELVNASAQTLNVINELVKRGLLVTYEKEVGRLNDGGEPHPERVNKLNPAQQKAMDEIRLKMESKNCVLLHGVTSSGKTEIYINLIQQEIEHGRQVLYLLPEIALTVQIMSRLKKVFGRRLGIYHSKYSDAERVEIWQKQLSDEPYDVILGARSAVLLPFQRLGLVIVDEEHETSYKQQDPAPRYHARSVALVLAQMTGAKTLLGTATPSIETYRNATTGKYGLVNLTTRYSGVELPETEIVDIGDLRRRKMMAGMFSPLLLGKIREAIERGEQAIVFQNRRGYAPLIECKQCGWVPHCNHCDVSLTLHKTTNQLVCHYCGFTYQVPDICPACGCKELRPKGSGTERIEDALHEAFPEANIARMDLDTTRTRNAYERIIRDFSAGRTNILIGTQMVTKGLDFDKVSVVGILNADNMLNYPDFRAYEHAYMMMAQVGGRAGRRGKRGLVVIQTYSPNLPVISQVTRGDYLGMYNDQLSERLQFHYPPFYHLIYLYMKHSNDKTVEMAAVEVSSWLRQWFGDRVKGPVKPDVGKIKTLNIRMVVLKLENGIDMAKVRQYLKRAREAILADKRYSTLTIYFDVDPV